jgi:hypothetical protein
MLSEGVNPMWVSFMLGHKNLAITLSIYAKYIPIEEIDRAKFVDNMRIGERRMEQEIATPNFAQSCNL